MRAEATPQVASAEPTVRPAIGNRVHFTTVDQNRGVVRCEGMVVFIDKHPRQGEPWVYIAEPGTNFLHVLYESDVLVVGSHYRAPHA